MYEDEIAKEIGESGHGVPRLPTLGDSYINPAYRAKSYDAESDLPHEETWWKEQKVREEIEEFVVRYLVTPSAPSCRC